MFFWDDVKSFLKKRSKTRSSHYLPEVKEDWFTLYFVEFKRAFRMAWNWKYLWIWLFVMILPSFRIFAKFSYGLIDLSFSTSIFLGSIILFFYISSWFINCVVRWGVLDNISYIQDKGNPRGGIMDVWKKGYPHFFQIASLDVIYLAMSILVLLVTFFGLMWIHMSFHNTLSEIVSLVFFIFALIFIYFLNFIYREITPIVMLLENKNVFNAIKRSWSLVFANIKELLKYSLIKFFIVLSNIYATVVSFIVFIVLAIIVFSPMLIFLKIMNFFVLFSIFAVNLFLIFVFLAFALSLVFTIIFTYISIDIRLWWVKRLIILEKNKC